MKKVLICICTYQREKKLKALLKSIEELDDVENLRLEIIVIDNEEDSKVSDVINNISSLKINYFKERNKGIVNARNRCIKESKNKDYDYLIFLDDDEVVDKKWLSEMLKFQEKSDAEIVCGPVVTIYPQDIDTCITKTKIYDRKILKTGTILNTCGCGNVLISKTVIINNDIIFDEEFNFIGGEDTDFFLKLTSQGYKIYFCAEAVVYEELVKSRSTLKYLIKRSFISGISCIKVQKKHKIINLLREFVITIMKIVICLIALILFNIININKSIFYISKLCINIGKILAILNLDNVKLY